MKRQKLFKYPRDKSVVEIFEKIAKKYPRQIALQEKNKLVSYKELNEKANQLARHLQDLGVQPQDFVGIYLERSIDLFIGILAILKAGAVYVPIDASYPMPRKLYMIRDTALKVLITDRAFASQFDVQGIQFLFLSELKLTQSKKNLQLPIQPLDLAYVNYTSGTTGNPKGVGVVHRGINRLVVNPDWITFSKTDRFLQISNISFDALTHELWGALLNGATLCIYPQIPLSPNELGRFIQEFGITQIIFTARLFVVMVEEALSSLKKVRYICSVGDVMSAKHAKMALKGLPSSCHLINACGHTENTTHTTAYTLRAKIENDVPIGRPIRGTTVYVLNEKQELTAFGEPGELCTGGDGLARGYLNQEALTREKFIQNPFGPGRLYRTGDLVRYLPDGNLSFLGRIDSQVKIRGFRIELSEVEQVLRNCPKVSDCIAMVRNDAHGDKELIVYLEASASLEEVQTWSASHLPAYMIPHFFVLLDHFPMTPNGKVDKKALPSPDIKTESRLQTPTEKKLGKIWEQVLQRQGIDRADSFFKIGGDSIRAMQVISLLKKTLGQEVSAALIFQHPVLSDFAHFLDTQKKEAIRPIRKRKKGGEIPLSFNQKPIWFIDQMNPNKLLYMIHYLYEVSGKIDPKKLKAALQKIIQRHEILRTRFTPSQKIVPRSENFFLQKQAKTKKQALLELEKMSLEGLRTDKLPLLQVVWVKVSSQVSLLFLRVHHLIFDILSYENFFSEWIALYQGKPVPRLPIQYADYTLWQKQEVQTPRIQKQISYWKNYLKEAPQWLELPWDHPRPVQYLGNGSTLSSLLPTRLVEGCKQWALQAGVTPFVLFFTLFFILLYRYSRQKDILVGTPFISRARPELDPLIGYFLQIFVIRARLTGDTSVSRLLQKTQASLSGAYQHADIPFEQIVEALPIERDPSFNPLFQVFFVYESISKSNIHFPQAALKLLPSDTKTAKFDLTFFLIEKEEGMECKIEYCTDFFDQSTIERMRAHFEHLMQSALQNPEQAVGDVALWTAQKAAVVEKQHYPHRAIPALFEEAVSKWPNKRAVKTLSYRQLNEKANQLARALQKKGVKPKDCVGVYLERSEALTIAVIAILKAGATYVPIDASYPWERKKYMIEHTDLTLLITQAPWKTQFPSVRLCILEDLELDAYDSSNLELVIDPVDIAYITYTSGSTGKPKGVEYPHLGLARLLYRPAWMKIGVGDKMLQIANISFDMFAAETFGALLNGAELCPYPQMEFSPLELGRFIQEHKISHLYLTARLFSLMVEEGLSFLSKVRFFASTGDVMSANHAKIAFDALPSCTIANLYGPTESHIATSYHMNGSEVLRIPIGKPVAGIQCYCLDERLKPVPIGVYGELYIGGEGLAKGYFRRSDLTEEKFVTNPFGPGKLYRTGDLVRVLADQTLDYLGRIDTQVKILGFRIELDEVEEILREHPKVADCAVIAHERGEKHLAAYIEPREDLTLEEIRSYAQTKLPKYSIPGYFVFLDQLPVTPNGKIDRRKLPAPQKQEEGFEAPATLREQQIASIWKGLLKVEKVGRNDDFFHLGGHSILAMQLHAKMHQELHLDVPVSLIFTESTLAKYAKQVEAKTVADKAPFAVWRKKEAVLDPEIRGAGKVQPSQYTHPKKIFLTGASGFIGAFFLKELLESTKAEIFCLCRAKSEREAQKKLIDTLKKYLIWNPKYKSRIVAVAGSLEKPLFGLSSAAFAQLGQQIDAVFHIGAFVNHAMSYAQHKPANVLGTQEVLRLSATGKLKPLHFISTVAVVDGGKPMPVSEDFEIDKIQTAENGYVESKWVGEKMIHIARKRGIPCAVFRLPRVSGDTQTGAGPTGDFLWRFLQGCIELKCAPKVHLVDDLMPVDFLCKSIHAISKNPKWGQSTFHVMPLKRLSYQTFLMYLRRLGYPLRFIDFVKWKKMLIERAQKTQDARLQSLASLLAEANFAKPLQFTTFSSTHFQRAYRSRCPKVDMKLFRKYVKYYIQTGFFHGPKDSLFHR